MTDPSVHEIYARLLKWYSHGHALYFPVDANEIKPGCVGYFDDKGRWLPLFRNVRDAPNQQPWEQLDLTEVNTRSMPDPTATRGIAVFTSEYVNEIVPNIGVELE